MHPKLRTEELSLIEAAAADSSSREFEILMTAFDLTEGYREYLTTVLQEGRWCHSPHPMSVLKRAVLSVTFGRRAKEERSAGVALGLSEKTMSFAFFREYEPDAVKGPDGTWKAGRGLDPQCSERESTIPLTYRLCDRRQLKAIDWEMIVDWLDQAGLDELEMEFVMFYLGQKCSRAKFVSAKGTDEKARKAAVAAVKRVQRKLPRIRQCLLGD
jgi:hypothetical protein